MIPKKYGSFFFAILLLFCTPRSDVRSSDAIDTKYILLQMSAVINSKKQDKIKEFFTYYVEDNAMFLKNSFVLDPEDINKIKKEESSAMTKMEYMNYLTQILEAPEQYVFWINQDSFKPNADGRYAIVSATIKEIEIIDVNKNKRMTEKSYAKVVVSTNCNFSFNIQPSIPIMTGSNCIEKIVIQ